MPHITPSADSSTPSHTPTTSLSGLASLRQRKPAQQQLHPLNRRNKPTENTESTKKNIFSFHAVRDTVNRSRLMRWCGIPRLRRLGITARQIGMMFRVFIKQTHFGNMHMVFAVVIKTLALFLVLFFVSNSLLIDRSEPILIEFDSYLDRKTDNSSGFKDIFSVRNNQTISLIIPPDQLKDNEWLYNVTHKLLKGTPYSFSSLDTLMKCILYDTEAYIAIGPHCSFGFQLDVFPDVPTFEHIDAVNDTTGKLTFSKRTYFDWGMTFVVGTQMAVNKTASDSVIFFDIFPYMTLFGIQPSPCDFIDTTDKDGDIIVIDRTAIPYDRVNFPAQQYDAGRLANIYSNALPFLERGLNLTRQGFFKAGGVGEKLYGVNTSLPQDERVIDYLMRCKPGPENGFFKRILIQTGYVRYWDGRIDDTTLIRLIAPTVTWGLTFPVAPMIGTAVRHRQSGLRHHLIIHGLPLWIYNLSLIITTFSIYLLISPIIFGFIFAQDAFFFVIDPAIFVGMIFAVVLFMIISSLSVVSTSELFAYLGLGGPGGYPNKLGFLYGWITLLPWTVLRSLVTHDSLPIAVWTLLEALSPVFAVYDSIFLNFCANMHGNVERQRRYAYWPPIIILLAHVLMQLLAATLCSTSIFERYKLDSAETEENERMAAYQAAARGSRESLVSGGVSTQPGGSEMRSTRTGGSRDEELDRATHAGVRAEILALRKARLATEGDIDAGRGYVLQVRGLKFSYPNRWEGKTDDSWMGLLWRWGLSWWPSSWREGEEEQDEAVLNGLTFGIKKGEIFGYLGRNGAGKSTTIKCLTGQLQPTAGEAYLVNRDLIPFDLALLGKIGFCPQENILFDSLTVLEHLELFCAVKRIPSDQNQDILAMQRVLKRFELVEVAHMAAEVLSVGIRRKLALALAFLGNPSLVFLDEPTTGVDVRARYNLWRILKKISRNCAIFLTTHSMEEADILCTRAAFLVDGYLAALGTPNSLRSDFADRYEVNIRLEVNDSNCDQLLDLAAQKHEQLEREEARQRQKELAKLREGQKNGGDDPQERGKRSREIEAGVIGISFREDRSSVPKKMKHTLTVSSVGGWFVPAGRSDGEGSSRKLSEYSQDSSPHRASLFGSRIADHSGKSGSGDNVLRFSSLSLHTDGPLRRTTTKDSIAENVSRLFRRNSGSKRSEKNAPLQRTSTKDSMLEDVSGKVAFRRLSGSRRSAAASAYSVNGTLSFAKLESLALKNVFEMLRRDIDPELLVVTAVPGCLKVAVRVGRFRVLEIAEKKRRRRKRTWGITDMGVEERNEESERQWRSSGTLRSQLNRSFSSAALSDRYPRSEPTVRTSKSNRTGERAGVVRWFSHQRKRMMYRFRLRQDVPTTPSPKQINAHTSSRLQDSTNGREQQTFKLDRPFDFDFARASAARSSEEAGKENKYSHKGDAFEREPFHADVDRVFLEDDDDPSPMILDKMLWLSYLFERLDHARMCGELPGFVEFCLSMPTLTEVFGATVADSRRNFDL
ncbi:hypothetical protein BJ742DRAFT_828509 [Cladochytrium replicatum]|nr:hypothetical protein BJ742DRAFT_828509 [Cladochytrium replicatum]